MFVFCVETTAALDGVGFLYAGVPNEVVRLVALILEPRVALVMVRRSYFAAPPRAPGVALGYSI